ncbi:hypothetical protein H6G89_01945 [Oscillatoria sp. FACHB-1407]|nr:hypothetical protein [Oscillatoria sp. FACHB-1407]MBD2459795.1 hypothetical protein [Oscillatoria sp. FACHB-1407]
MVRKLRTKVTAQILMLGKLPSLPPPHRMWLRLYRQAFRKMSLPKTDW